MEKKVILALYDDGTTENNIKFEDIMLLPALFSAFSDYVRNCDDLDFAAFGLMWAGANRNLQREMCARAEKDLDRLKNKVAGIPVKVPEGTN